MYRHEVLIMLPLDEEKTFLDAVSKLPEDVKIRVEEVLECFDRIADESQGIAIYQAEDIQWDEFGDDGEVPSFIESWLIDLGEDRYRFVRIGDDFDDVDVHGTLQTGKYYYCVTRRIENTFS